MKILAKLGGTLLDQAASRERLAAEIADEVRGGAELVIVHGGGKQMTQFLQERGVESQFIGGLRVSTPAVIDAVLKVIAGSVNQELVASLVAAGVKAVGLSGIDAGLVRAELLDERLGAVGKPVHCEGRLLNLLVEQGYTPTVACVAGDSSGRIYNVNADQMAVACAGGFGAQRLLFLTDVPGVKDASGNLIPLLTPAACEQLIASGVAHGGMQAKLNAATDALARGVEEVVIAPGQEPGTLAALLAGETRGTRLRPKEA